MEELPVAATPLAQQVFDRHLAGARIDRRRPRARRRLARDAHTRIRARPLRDRDAQRKEVASGAAHLLAGREAEQAELAHLPHDVVAELVIAVELLRRRGDHLAREVAARVADCLLFVAKCKIHRDNPCRRWPTSTTRKASGSPAPCVTSTGRTSTRSATPGSTRTAAAPS